MKKLLILLAALTAVVAVSCTQDGKKYVVSGTSPEDAALVYLVDQITNEPVDSAFVADGAFAFKGKADENALMGVRYADRKISRWVGQFFNDGVPVTVDFAGKTVAGSDLNNQLNKCKQVSRSRRYCSTKESRKPKGQQKVSLKITLKRHGLKP